MTIFTTTRRRLLQTAACGVAIAAFRVCSRPLWPTGVVRVP